MDAMRIHSFTYRSHDPLRPVAWRARRVRRLIRRGREVSSERDDRCTIEYFHFQCRWKCCSGKAERRQVAIRYPDIIAAQRLRHGDPWRRLLIEARLLAGQPIGPIAAAMGTTASAIERYEQLFFAVSDRLGSPDYIVVSAVRRAAPPVTPAGLAAYILSLAFFGGPAVLEATLTALGPHACLACQPADISTREGRLVEQIRLAAQLHLLPGRPPGDVSYLRAMPVLTAGETLLARHSPPQDVAQVAMASVADFPVDLAALPRRTTRAAAKDSQAA